METKFPRDEDIHPRTRNFLTQLIEKERRLGVQMHGHHSIGARPPEGELPEVERVWQPINGAATQWRLITKEKSAPLPPMPAPGFGFCSILSAEYPGVVSADIRESSGEWLWKIWEAGGLIAHRLGKTDTGASPTLDRAKQAVEMWIEEVREAAQEENRRSAARMVANLRGGTGKQ